MNTKNKIPTARFLAVALLAGGVSLLALTGCNKHDRDQAGDKVKDAYQDTKDAVANGWDKVKSYSFDKKDDFTANAKALNSKMEAEVAELRANYSEANASASRKAAMAELKNSEADYKEKLSALGNATADTWDSAKQNVIASWDKLKASYDKARAN
jgi:hypothetical protein